MLHHETIDVIKRSASIPSMPMVANRCYEMTQSPDFDFGKLVELLSTDPGIAADVLRLSNSALFGVTRPVGSLKQAIALLGVKRIRELVLTRYLVQKMHDISADVIDIDYFWRRSLATAVIAARFADSLCPAHRDEAFVGGLLADAGVIVLARALPKHYAPIARQYKPLQSDDWLIAEYHLMGVTHGEVSALVMKQWNLPESMAEAVKYHHTPASEMPSEGPGLLLARIIGGSGQIARIISEANDMATACATSARVMNSVGLETQVLVQALDDIDTEVRSLSDLLKVEILRSKVFSTLGRNLCEHLREMSSH